MQQLVRFVSALRGSALRTALAACLVVLAAGTAVAQGGAVTGTVVEETSGRPLAGARVAVEGTNRAVATDARGRFTITGLTGTEVRLQASFVGRRAVTQTARVGATDVRIALAETAVALDELVVTGTAGAQQRREIGNSVTQVRAADVVAASPVRNMQQLLTGRAPGVFVVPSSGNVGTGQRIRIRGQSTFSLSGDPLIYVDGLRVNNESSSGISVQGFGSGAVSRLNDINPEDIETIEILKGPAAATLYGTEAARGVINIITKKGSVGGTRFNFVTRQGASWFSNPEGRLPTNYWRDPTGNVQSLDIYERETALGYEVFRTGRVQGYTGSVSGGSEAARYFVSADYDNDEGIDPTNDKQQFSGRANVQFNASENFDMNVSTGYINSDTRLACEAGCGGRMWGVMFSSPRLLGENCAPNAPLGCGFSRGYRSWPLQPLDVWQIRQGINRFTGSVTGNWRPFRWMSHRVTVGRDLTNENNVESLEYPTNDTVRYFWAGPLGNGYRFQNLREVIFDTYDYSGTVNLNVREGLNSQTSVGVQYYTKDFQIASVQGEGFPGPGVTTVAAAAARTFQNQDYWQNRTLGVFFQQQLGWRDRLFLTGAVRVDNNSAFGSEVDFVTYPKASVSWVLHEEPLFSRVQPSFLNTLRLRAAYGESGTQPELNSALRTFSPVPGPGGTSAVMPTSVGNPELKPERGREIELGFDAGFLNDRVGLDFTYYRTRTTDAILFRPVPPSGGFPGNQWVNAGEILNTGIEAQLRTQLLSRRNIGWEMNVNVATNDSEVRKLAGSDTTLIVGSVQHKLGYPAHAWFRERVVSAEYNPSTRRTINALCDDGQGGTTPCFDAAGRVIAPRVFLGRTTPTLEGSVSSTLSFLQAFRLSGMLDYKSGFSKFDNNLRARCQVFSLCIENMEPQNADPRILAQMQTTGTLVDFVINDATFARLREVSLGVDVPGSWVRQFGGRTASINFAARNLHTWTNYTGLDPEVMFLGGSVAFQFEQNQVPHPVHFVTTINLNF